MDIIGRCASISEPSHNSDKLIMFTLEMHWHLYVVLHLVSTHYTSGWFEKIMSKKTFTGIRRWAIYEVHKKKCFWCYKPLNFKEMEVDHVVPESTVDVDVEQIKIDHNLPKNFHVNCNGNLVASCGECNNAKTNKEYFGKPIMMVYLDLALERAPNIEQQILNIRRARWNESKAKDMDPDYDMVQVFWRTDGGVDVVIRRFKPMGTSSTHSELYPGSRTHTFYPKGHPKA